MRIAEPIPSWLLQWAERGIASGDWDGLYHEPDYNRLTLAAFVGIELEIAESLLRGVANGDVVVRDTAAITPNELVERLADAY